MLLTTSPAFLKWFGQSKVVDPQNRPLKVYHGTGANTGPALRPGSYFTPMPEVAAIYAAAPTRQAAGGGPNVVPVYLSLQNPYIFDDAVIKDNLSHHILGRRGAHTEVFAKLTADGYDGLIMKNYLDLGGSHDQYVAFESEQVWSAISPPENCLPTVAELLCLAFRSNEDISQLAAQGLSFDVMSRGETVTLESIFVEPNSRGQGFGSRALEILLALADEHNVAVDLEVGFDEAGIDLVAWYSRHGFIWSENCMVREPETPVCEIMDAPAC